MQNIFLFKVDKFLHFFVDKSVNMRYDYAVKQ